MVESQRVSSPSPDREAALEGTPVHFVARSPLGERLVGCRVEVLALADRRQASNVRVFGSLARGDDHPGSDLEDLLGVKVDVGTPDTLRPFLRDEVLAQAVPL
jgi:predicted nucleotidyltransferase